MIGFSFSFGASDNNTNPYIGTGEFFFDPFSTDENTVKMKNGKEKTMENFRKDGFMLPSYIK